MATGRRAAGAPEDEARDVRAVYARPVGAASAGAVAGVPADAESAGPPGDPAEVARIVCLRLLDRRAYTRAELLKAVRRRGVPDDVTDRVLDRFTELGLIDDTALADGFALAAHRERGLAGRAVAAKLRQRGIGDEAVRAAVDQIDRDSEVAAAQALVARRLRSLGGVDPTVQARRLVGLLARKGYAPGLAHEVVRSALRASIDLDDDLTG